jgi:thermitase
VSKNLPTLFKPLLVAGFLLAVVALSPIKNNFTQEVRSQELKDSEQSKEKLKVDSDPEFISNEILVKFKSEAAEILKAKTVKNSVKQLDLQKENSEKTGLPELDIFAKNNGILSIEPMLDQRNWNSKAMNSELGKWFVVKINPESKNVKNSSSEYNLLSERMNLLKENKDIEVVELRQVLKPSFTPNDPVLPSQWQLGKTNSYRAWDIVKGFFSVKVAVIDSGIGNNGYHPDLAGRVIDSVDFTGSPYGTSDYHEHGTKTAGIIAAWGNNDLDVSGISPNVSILNVKSCDDTGNCGGNVEDGITWAVENDADIINMSLGALNSCPQSIQDAVDAATPSAVVVAAGGNDSANGIAYPANCINVISVAALLDDDTKRSNSNYHSNMSLAAPGQGLLTTAYKQIPTSYGTSTFSMTSSAAPVVSAVAALVKSVDSSLTPQMIRNIVQYSADQIAQTGTYWKYGRVNALQAVHEVPIASGPDPLINGQIGYWQFDESNGTTTLTDASDNGFNGTIGSSNSYSSGHTNNALINPGSSAGAAVPYSVSSALDITGASPLTVAFWLKATSLSHHVQLVQTISNGVCGGWGVGYHSDGSVFLSDYCDGHIAWPTGTVTADSQWHHFAMSYNGTSASLYKDGALVSTINYVPSWTSATRTLYIGGDSAYPLQGAIDELGIWNRALSSAEIGQLYSGGQYATYPYNGAGFHSNGASSNLLSFWSMNEDSGTTLHNIANTQDIILDGTLSSANSFGPGKRNKALVNPGTSAGATVSYAAGSNLDITGNSPLTISAWLRADYLQHHVQLIQALGGCGGWGFGYHLDGSVFLSNYCGSNITWPTGTVTADSQWHHLLVTYNGTSATLYKDGSAVSTINYTPNWTSGSRTLYIGGDWTYPLQGAIDEVGIWGRVLNSGEINKLSLP